MQRSRKNLLGALLALALASACGGGGQLSDLQKHEATWASKSIGSYSYAYQAARGDPYLALTVTVRDGAVASTDCLYGCGTGKTVEDLFSDVQARLGPDWEGHGSCSVETTYDEILGYPTRVLSTCSSGAVDGWSVTDFQTGSM
jgi:hypothetical protein